MRQGLGAQSPTFPSCRPRRTSTSTSTSAEALWRDRGIGVSNATPLSPCELRHHEQSLLARRKGGHRHRRQPGHRRGHRGAPGRAGAAVVLAARKPDALAAVASRLEAAEGAGAGGRGAHRQARRRRHAWWSGRSRASARWTCLVNNAATNPYFGPMLDVETGAWDKTFEVNVKGYFLAAREVVRHLEKRGANGQHHQHREHRGSRAAPLQGVYGMTKAAVISHDPDAWRKRSGASASGSTPSRRGWWRRSSPRSHRGQRGAPRSRRGPRGAPSARPARRDRRSGGLPRLRGVVVRDRPGAGGRRRHHQRGVAESSRRG